MFGTNDINVNEREKTKIYKKFFQQNLLIYVK